MSLLYFPSSSSSTSGGKVLQVQNSFLATTTSMSSSTPADTGLSCDITPASTDNKIFCLVNLGMVGYSANGWGNFHLMRDSTEIGAGTSTGTDQDTMAHYPSSSVNTAFGNNFGWPVSIHYLDSPSSTSAITYKLQFSTTSLTASPSVYINRRAYDTQFITGSSLSVFEIEG